MEFLAISILVAAIAIVWTLKQIYDLLWDYFHKEGDFDPRPDFESEEIEIPDELYTEAKRMAI